MPDSLPVRLEHPPLIDALFEIRFPTTKPPAGDVLTGLLFNSFRDEFSDVQTLPVANVPRSIRDGDANLRYQASHQLAFNNELIQIGDRNVVVRRLPPYAGWNKFSKRIHQVLEAVRATGIVGKLERASMRAVNLLPVDAGKSQLSMLNYSMDIAGMPIVERGLRLRVEIDASPFINIIQLAPDTTVQFANEDPRTGLLVDLDSIRTITSEDFWGQCEETIDAAHLNVKRMFFSVLTDETIKSFGPIWEES